MTIVNSVKWYRIKEKCIVHCKYFRCLHRTKAIVFSILSPVMTAKFYLSSICIDRVSLFHHIIYSSADTHTLLAMYM